MLDKIVLVGGGEHCKVVIEAIEKQNRYQIVYILDQKDKIGKKIGNYKINGSDEDVEKIYQEGIRNCHIILGSIGNTSIREELFWKLNSYKFNFPVIIHP